MIRSEQPYDGVVVVTLDRSPVNAIDDQHVEDLAQALSDAKEAKPRVLVITGAGRLFSAGADIDMISERFASASGREDMVAFTATLQHVCQQIEDFPAPTLAAIRGAATGGGLEVALACDLRLATSTARLGLPEVRLGLIPGGGGTQRLTKVAGRATALRLILGAELVDAKEAERLGLVQWSVDESEFEDRWHQLAKELAEVSPFALAEAKQCIEAAATPNGYERERQATRTLMATEEAIEGVRAFLGTRKVKTEKKS